MRSRAAVLLVALLFACGSNDPALAQAQETCGQLEDARTPIQRRVAEEDLIEATDLGEQDEGKPSFADVLLRMRELCPEAVDELLGTGADTGVGTEEVDITVDDCGDNTASGTVTNKSDIAVDVSVKVRVVDDADTLLGNGSTTVDGLQPGQLGKWEAFHGVDDSGFTCRGSVDRVTAD